MKREQQTPPPPPQAPTKSSPAQTNEVAELENSDISVSSALKDLLDLQDQIERKKETAVREIMDKKASLTEAYQAEIAKLDALLAKIAPELVAPPAPPQPQTVTAHVPPRVRARAEAIAVAAGRSEGSAKWNAQKFCPYCQIQGHDGRAHRGQVVAKKWTQAELAAFGYLPPAGQPQLPANYDLIPQVKGQLG
jgi:hypothetical protein